MPQYGTPDIAMLSPAGTCASNVANVLLMSPDQHAPPYRCMPGPPERQRRYTRPSGRSAASPSANACMRSTS